MAFLQKANNARTTLAEDIAIAEVAWDVTDGTVFPAAVDFMLTVWKSGSYTRPGLDPDMEIVRCTAGAGTNTLTVTRAQEGTADVAHDSGDTVDNLITAGTFDEHLNQDVKTTDNVIFNTGSFSDVVIPTIQTDMAEPTGFVDRVATLSFVDGTRTFTITGDHDIYINGVKTTKTTDDIILGDTTGMHWIYYDAAGTLSETTGDPNFSLPLIATVYYNTVAGFDKGLLGEERHGFTMNYITHRYLHYSVGTRYISGLTGTFADATFDTTLGIIYDEDILHSIGAETTCDVLYKDGAADFVWLENQTKYYYEDVGSDINYNNGNALAAATSNYYVAYWIFATNSTTRPIVSLMGQREDKKLIDARANNKYESLTLGTLPFEEMKLLYRVILKNDATPYEETQDLRAVSNLPAGTYIATQHNALTGLNWANSGHTIDTNIAIGANYISNDGDSEGMSVDVDGNVILSGTLSGVTDITMNGAFSLQSAIDSTTAFQILDNDGGNPIFNVDTTNERVSIGSIVNEMTLGGVTVPMTFVVHTNGTADIQGDIEAHRFSNTAINGATYFGARARGTEDSPIIIENGDVVASISGWSYDGVDYESSASMTFLVDGTVAEDSVPGAIVFSTTSEGERIVTAKMSIDSEGLVTLTGDLLVDGTNIGITADSDLLAMASGALTVNGTLDVGAITTTGDIDINVNGGSLTIDVFELSDYANQFIFRKNITGVGLWNFDTLDGLSTARTNTMYLWGLGGKGYDTNYERMGWGFTTDDADRFRIFTDAGGTGTVRPLELLTGANTGQLYLNTDGSITSASEYFGLLGTGNTTLEVDSTGGIGTLKLDSNTTDTVVSFQEGDTAQFTIMHDQSESEFQIRDGGFTGTILLKWDDGNTTAIFSGNVTIPGELQGSKQILQFTREDSVEVTSTVTSFTDYGKQRTSGTKGFTAMRAGSITGVSINYDITATNGGTASIQVYVNGAAVWQNTVVGATSTGTDKEEYFTQARDTDQFSAGDTITVVFWGIGVGGTSNTFDNTIIGLEIYSDA